MTELNIFLHADKAILAKHIKLGTDSLSPR